ncbi:MAG: hypothetical protein WD029_01065 [Microthrixaceae bacterium]
MSPSPNGKTTSQQTAAQARAEFEAQRAASSAERRERMNLAFGDGIPGRWVVSVSWASTAVFAGVTAAAVIDPEEFVGAFFLVSVCLFLAGSFLFAADIALAASRSRDDLMGIGGLFFLAGSAPRAVRLGLLGSLFAQLVIAILGAAARPFTPLAFGTLVPILGLSLCGLWAVRYGLFPAQQEKPVAQASSARRRS